MKGNCTRTIFHLAGCSEACRMAHNYFASRPLIEHYIADVNHRCIQTRVQKYLFDLIWARRAARDSATSNQYDLRIPHLQPCKLSANSATDSDEAHSALGRKNDNSQQQTILPCHDNQPKAQRMRIESESMPSKFD